MADTRKTSAPETNPDDLDHEGGGGKRLIVDHKGERFEIEDIAHNRKWREVAQLLAAASGEMGISNMEPAMLEIVGEEQLARTDEWDFADFMHFAVKVGERIGASVGTPGESRGSRR